MSRTSSVYSNVARGALFALTLLVALIATIPVGVYLEWSAPRDLPACVCVYPSTGAALLAGAWVLHRRARTMAARGGPARAAASGLLVLAAVVLLATSVPPIGRRVGPWAELRSLLVAKSQEVAEARAALGIPQDRPLTGDEMNQIAALVLNPPPEYTFPIIQRTVHPSLMCTSPPYVGVDFGGGRRAVFDLQTMVVIYAD